MKKITIIGASGHGKVVADIARLKSYDMIGFLDDNPLTKECGKYPVMGKTDQIVDGDLFVAIGNADIRRRLSINKKLITLVHPNAVVAHDVEMGEGSVVMAGAVINPGVKIGKGVIVNTTSVVDHDCILGNFVHVAVGAHLCGAVTVGDNTWIGAGATISNNVSICGGCIIGAGAVVIKDIRESGTYVGVPAKEKKMERLNRTIHGGGNTI